MRLDAEQRLAGWTLLALSLLLAAVAVMPHDGLAWVPVCPFLQLTGLYCPGCGATRMLYLLMHGHPLLAARENVMAAGLLPVLIARLVQRALGVRDPVPKAWLVPAGMVLGVLVIAFTVVRNVPKEPFSQLAPVPLAEILRESR